MPAGSRIASRDALRRICVTQARYAVRLLPALVTSVIVFGVLDWLRVRTGIGCAAAFAAGGVLDWYFNRPRTTPTGSRGAWLREAGTLTLLAVLVWVTSTWATGNTQNWVQAHLGPGDLSRVLLTTAAYVVVQSVFFAIKLSMREN